MCFLRTHTLIVLLVGLGKYDIILKSANQTGVF